jgi:hypothetical protein
LRSARAEYGRADGNSAVSPPAGFTLGGTSVDLAEHKAGYAVWYASSKCPFCQKDQEFRGLAAALEHRGVSVVVLLPSAADSFPGGELLPEKAPQLVYINAEWLRRYPLSVTPTLLIFDSEHRLIWRRYGMMRPADAKAALSTVDVAIRRP